MPKNHDDDSARRAAASARANDRKRLEDEAQRVADDAPAWTDERRREMRSLLYGRNVTTHRGRARSRVSKQDNGGDDAVV